MKRSLMAAIDLHSNNLFCGIVDEEGRHVFDKKLPCRLPTVIAALKPFAKRIDTIAVESTYNWYWLVDGLQDNGFKVVLANPAQMEQYSGLKHTDDRSDAFFLAEMLRLKILPTGYICDRKLRAVRDLFRRRMALVQKRTSLMLSLGSLYTRMTGQQLPQRELKALDAADALTLFDDPCDQLITEVQLKLLTQLDESIAQIESTVLKRAMKMSTYKVLQTIPGIGRILGMTISMETVDPKRFASAGDFASYCRCVDSRRVSNGKKKGENNSKCGNKYLAWAFVEAANFAKRYDLQCRRFYDRKSAQTNSIVATKALACKLAKAAWHMMSENTEYDAQRIFPPLPQKHFRERLKSHGQVLAKSPQD
jgi:transposase